jgi:stage III sporulation protein AG
MEQFTKKAKEVWAKIRTIKNIEIIIGIVIICMVVLIYSSVTSKAVSSSEKTGISAETASEATDIEKRLSAILSQIEGAGEVRVMVTYETDSVASASSQAEEDATIKGVVIVADGADDIKVRMNLIRAARTLLNVEADAIEVFDRN